MGKKKKQPSPAGSLVGVLAQLVGVVVLVLTFLSIFAVFGIWLYFESASKKYRGVQGRSDFSLTSEEEAKLNEARREASIQAKRLSEIQEMRAIIPLKKDGTFDERSREGRGLNTELHAVSMKHEQARRTIDDLTTAEERDFRQWVKIKSGLLASRVSLIALFLSAGALLVRPPPLAYSISDLIERTTDLHPLFGVAGSYGVLSISAALALSTFLVCWVVGRSAGLLNS